MATRTVSPGCTQRVSTMLPVSTTSPATRGRPLAAAFSDDERLRDRRADSPDPGRPADRSPRPPCDARPPICVARIPCPQRLWRRPWCRLIRWRTGNSRDLAEPVRSPRYATRTRMPATPVTRQSQARGRPARIGALSLREETASPGSSALLDGIGGDGEPLGVECLAQTHHTVRLAGAAKFCVDHQWSEGRTRPRSPPVPAPVRPGLLAGEIPARHVALD